MKRVDLVALLHSLTFVLVVAVSLLAEPRLSIPTGLAKGLGTAGFFVGMTGFTWALTHLKGAFFGNVEPVADRLITSGPYRWVRHPMYLSMVVASLGLALALRSPWGMVGTLLLFAPAGAYRAWIEERALGRRFGLVWETYVRRTYFMFPPVW